MYFKDRILTKKKLCQFAEDIVSGDLKKFMPEDYPYYAPKTKSDYKQMAADIKRKSKDLKALKKKAKEAKKALKLAKKSKNEQRVQAAKSKVSKAKSRVSESKKSLKQAKKYKKDMKRYAIVNSTDYISYIRRVAKPRIKQHSQIDNAKYEEMVDKLFEAQNSLGKNKEYYEKSARRARKLLRSFMVRNLPREGNTFFDLFWTKKRRFSRAPGRTRRFSRSRARRFNRGNRRFSGRRRFSRH